MISASYGPHLRDVTAEILGFPLSRNFVLFDKGTAIIHRDNEEWYKEMPPRWAVALEKKHNFDAIRKTINDTADSIHCLQNMELTPTLTSLIELRRAITQGVPGMIFAHWVPIYDEQKLANYKRKDVLYFEGARREIEKFFSLAAEVAYQFLDLLSQKHNLNSSLLKYATYDELVALILTSTIDTSSLSARKNKRLLFVEDALYLGEDITPYLINEGYVFDEPQILSPSSIQGTVACRGVAIGKAQIIVSREYFGQFKEGSILVAPMTSPEYTPLIQRAKAIVTDEGGMLSHAAIVSRELNKPCLIGTKHASYSLKDFQEIEVDAVRGVVKVLR